MKVSNEHLSILKRWTQKAMTDNNVTIKQWENVYSDKTEQRKLWDLYWLTMDSSVIAANIIRPIFDQYMDSHIETALRHIYKELN
jgi:hypothetical protein